MAVVILEGIDGCGKSSVVRALKEKVDDSTIVHAPTDCVKQYICQGSSVASSLFMLIKDLVDIFQKTIIPAMIDGKFVIVDRFWPSTVVYQTQQINQFLCMPPSDIHELCAKAISIALMESFSGDPDLIKKAYYSNPIHVFVLDTPVDVAMQRLAQRNGLDKFENVSREEMEERRNTYIKLKKKNSLYHILPTGNKTPETLALEILNIVQC